MKHNLETLFDETVERCRMEGLVLAIQDTKTLKLKDRGYSRNFRPDDSGGDEYTNDILMHCGIAINAAGRPLGMFGMDATFGEAEGKTSVRWEEGLARARELSVACPNARVVTVCDRDGDFWEQLLSAKRSGDAIMVGVRRPARRRVARPDGSDEDLWLHVGKVDPAGHLVIEVPGRGDPRRHRARNARLTIRCKEVDLVPPAEQGDSPIRMLAVSAVEDNPPRSAAGYGKGLRWMLLTTEGEASFESACTALRWYELRWRVEPFFHALKTGNRIDRWRFDEDDDLYMRLPLEAFIALKVWDLALLVQEMPNDLALSYVVPEEVAVLAALALKRGFKIPRESPETMTISEFAVLAAGQAGFHPSKKLSLPGTQKLWQGLKILDTAVFVYSALLNRDKKSD